MTDVKSYSENPLQYCKLIILLNNDYGAQKIDATLGVDFSNPVGLKIRNRF